MIGKIVFIVSMIIIALIFYFIIYFLVGISKMFNEHSHKIDKLNNSIIAVHNNTLILENRLSKIEKSNATDSENNINILQKV